MTEQPNEIERIKAALDALLTLAIEHDMRPRAGPPGPLKLISCAELFAKPIPTRREFEINRVLDDPICGATRNAIRLLGERLFEVVGNTDSMRGILEEVATRDDRHWGRRIDIMDKRWNGIGAGADRWWS